uniref:Helicase ARIP4 n=1 Tax=Anisakis simplex TaxID=6269 RepID=A0A0M3IYF2_ANISI
LQGPRAYRTKFDDQKLSSSTQEAQRMEKERLQRLGINLTTNSSEEAHSSSCTPVQGTSSSLLDDGIVKKESESTHNDTESADEVILLSSDSDEDLDHADVTKPQVMVLEDETERLHRIERERIRKRRASGELESTELSGGQLLINANKPANDPDVYVNKHLASVLKPHQIGGVRFMYDNVIETINGFEKSPGFGCILAHVMGLGKTIQVIAFSDIFLRTTASKTILIIVPINTILNWISEYDRWLPNKLDESGKPIREFSLLLLGDNVKTAEQRMEVLEKWRSQGGVLLIGYDMFRLLVNVQPPKKVVKRRGVVSSNTKKMKIEVIDLEKEEIETTNRKGCAVFFALAREALLDPGPDLVVCDEGHRIKNDKTGIAASLNAIRTRRRIVLTGYPLQNNLLEYYCMVDFVRPNFLGTKKEFKNMFERPIKNGLCIDSTPNDVRLAQQRTHVLSEMLKGFVQRRTHHLLKQILPESYEYVLLLRKSEIQRVLYRAFLQYAQSEITSIGYTVFNPLKAFAACSKVCSLWVNPLVAMFLDSSRALCNEIVWFTTAATHLRNANGANNANNDTNKGTAWTSNKTIAKALLEEMGFDKGVRYDWAALAMGGYQTDVIENGYKMAISLEIIRKANQIGDKVLLFSQSLLTLNLIERFLERFSKVEKEDGTEEPWKRNRTFLRFDGSTSASEREKLINRFNNDPGVLLFLISTRAGSLGINLVSANRVIIFDASWNPCHDAQAVCRIYRYGQQKRTFIYRLIVDNCMEKGIFNRQIGKNGLQQRVVDDRQLDVDVTKSELEQLLVYDEALDVLTEPHNVTSWNITDNVLWSAAVSHSYMFAQEPFLHDSLLMEREAGLSEEEKAEARLLYEQEKNIYKGLEIDLGPIGSVMPLSHAEHLSSRYRTGLDRSWNRNASESGGGQQIFLMRFREMKRRNQTVLWLFARCNRNNCRPVAPPGPLPMRATPLPMGVERVTDDRSTPRTLLVRVPNDVMMPMSRSRLFTPRPQANPTSLSFVVIKFLSSSHLISISLKLSVVILIELFITSLITSIISLIFDSFLIAINRSSSFEIHR